MQVSFAQLGPPVDLRPLFALQRHQLAVFLRGLEADDWRRSTACSGWDVADVLAHVVGGVLGRVGGRDRNPGAVGESLGERIDRANQEWVVACRRFSPQVMLDMLDWAGGQADHRWQNRRLDEPGLGVSWAGVDPAPLWLDAAREVTEYWVHERQLRAAVGNRDEGLPDVATVLDVFARGLPSTLGRSNVGQTGDRIRVESAGRSWRLRCRGDQWWFVDEGDPDETVLVFDGELLWRRWTRQPSTPPIDMASLSPLERAVFDHVAIVHSTPDAT